MNLVRSLINLVLPPRCVVCGKVLSINNGLCPECFNKIHFISEPLCLRCGRPFDSAIHLQAGKQYLCSSCLREKRSVFKMKRSAFIYDDEAKNLILDFKFKDKTISAEILANMMFSAGRDIWADKPDVIIPVPIHRVRLLKRRYNQSALLVKKLAILTAIKPDYKSLVRCQNTIPQVQLSGSARRRNLKNAFTVLYLQNIKGKKVVLVDDVETTGSTLKECAKVLRKAGAKEIYALTAARTEI